MLLREFYATFFEPLRLRSRAENTRRLYRTTLNNFEVFLGRSATIADLNDDEVGRFLDWFRRLPRSPYSTNKERSNLLCIWRWACRRQGADGNPLLRSWPNVEPELEPEDDPLAWLPEELDRLFNAIRREPGKICGVVAGDWWYALHCVLWDTGERIRAILRTDWQHVNLPLRWFYCHSSVRKGGRGGQKGKGYALHADTVEALEAIRHPKRDLVFPWPYAETYVWYRYNLILKRTGLPTDRKSKFHRMRKSVASHAEAAGGNATELLGHSSRKVTLRYLDPRIVKGTHASELLFRPQVKEHEHGRASGGRKGAEAVPGDYRAAPGGT